MEQDNSCNIKRWELLKRELKNLKPIAFLDLLTQKGEVQLLDVRTPGEFASGSIPGAANMDFLGLDYWDQFDALDKQKPTFVFCRSGRRSVRTVMFMKNGGFAEVYNMDGGLNALSEIDPSRIEEPNLV